MELRAATDGDLVAMHATSVDALEALFAPLGLDPPGPPLGVFESFQRHVASTGTLVVAEDGDGVAGFGGAWTRGDDWFLSSLFARPRAQARGVGSALLDAVWGEARRRRTITDAVQPISNALYARRGLIPATPVLWFTGVPRLDERAEPADADLAAIDAAAYGFDRAVDHAYWSRAAARTTWGGAYSYRFPGGDIGPVAGLTPAAAARALAAELSRAEGPVRVRVPGSSRALVEVLLRAGLRLGGTPGLLLLSDGIAAPTALAPGGYALF